jgi:Protein of unknown function (DUF559)/Transcriptional regulator, AbiEi antitoxin
MGHTAGTFRHTARATRASERARVPAMPELPQDPPGRRAQAAADRARAVAEAQEGVLSRRQLLACGVSSSRIGRWVRRGWLLRLHPGVYALGHRAISPRGRLIAALLYAGAGSVLSHGTAAHHWALIAKPPPQIHVSAPVGRRNLRGVVVHTPRAILRDRHDGMPVTSVARTLMDTAARVPAWQLRKALAEADFRDRLDPEDLRRTMGRGHPGSARLRRATEGHMPELARTLSPLEDQFLLLCEGHGIPMPEPNARVGRYMVDALWAEEHLIVELDGAAAHSSPDQRRRDEHRTAVLRELGYRVLRFTWHDVVRNPGAVAATVLAALAAN